MNGVSLQVLSDCGLNPFNVKRRLEKEWQLYIWLITPITYRSGNQFI
jgi:hypothetical protein